MMIPTSPLDTVEPLLKVTGLCVSFPGRGWRAPVVDAVKDFDFSIRRGRTLGIVGESGSGKSTVAKAVLGLVTPNAGSIRFNGQELVSRDSRRRVSSARAIQAVYQDPYSSLNPRMTIGQSIAEPLYAAHWEGGRARQRVGEVLEMVKLPPSLQERKPHEFSGGQRQRIGIARALAGNPELVILDEAVAALDLSTQAHILDLLVDIQEASGVSYLFITHDLSVVRYMCHDTVVVRQGSVVESGTTDAAIGRPANPYTARLLMSSPVADPDEQERRRERLRGLGHPPVQANRTAEHN